MNGMIELNLVSLTLAAPSALPAAEPAKLGESKEAKIPPPDGVSLLPPFKGEAIARNRPLFFQFNKGSTIRDGQWKLVRNSPTWERYDFAADRTETHDRAAQRPELVKQMDAAWRAWWKDCTGSRWPGMDPKKMKSEMEE